MSMYMKRLRSRRRSVEENIVRRIKSSRCRRESLDADANDASFVYSVRIRVLTFEHGGTGTHAVEILITLEGLSPDASF